jgi:hypothetical protein
MVTVELSLKVADLSHYDNNEGGVLIRFTPDLLTFSVPFFM